MFKLSRTICAGLAAAACATVVMTAPASASANLGFETGDISGWATNGNASAVTLYGPLAPVSGGYLGAVEAGLGENVYTTLSQAFVLNAGGTISGWTAFKANDNFFDPQVAGVFNDDGYLSVNGANLIVWDVATVGDFASSGWTHFSFTATAAGAYMLEAGVANRGDNTFSSAVLLDAVHVTGEGAVPEAATWAMMVMGFGLAGAALRSRRSAVSFG